MRFWILDFGLWVLLLTAGCATSARRSPQGAGGARHHSGTLSLQVPFIPQKPEYCGPAALAMLANYYGHPVTQDEIAHAIYLPSIHGTLTAELADYAQRFQLFVRQYRGSWTDIEEKTRAGVPLIVLGKLGDHNHYFVVLQASDPLVVHTDRRPFEPMPREEFLRWWDRMGRWTLLVCPPARMTWNLSAAEHNDLGYYFEQAGRNTEAVTHYKTALRLKPGNPFVALNLGNALRKQGQLREAAAAFARAPGNADALNNRADVLCELGEQLDEAAALCQRAIELLPGHRAYYLDTLGSIRLKQGKKQEAITAFEQALAATTDRQASLRAAIRQHLEATKQ